jgi:hypothetical protein
MSINCLETQKLYETIRFTFIEEHYSTLKPTIVLLNCSKEIEDFYAVVHRR